MAVDHRVAGGGADTGRTEQHLADADADMRDDRQAEAVEVIEHVAKHVVFGRVTAARQRAMVGLVDVVGRRAELQFRAEPVAEFVTARDLARDAGVIGDAAAVLRRGAGRLSRQREAAADAGASM